MLTNFISLSPRQLSQTSLGIYETTIKLLPSPDTKAKKFSSPRNFFSSVGAVKLLRDLMMLVIHDGALECSWIGI